MASISYTTDCAKAMILLSKTDSSFNQVCRLPSCNPGFGIFINCGL